VEAPVSQPARSSSASAANVPSSRLADGPGEEDLGADADGVGGVAGVGVGAAGWISIITYCGGHGTHANTAESVGRRDHRKRERHHAS
jgi:hypothetical protein